MFGSFFYDSDGGGGLAGSCTTFTLVGGGLPKVLKTLREVNVGDYVESLDGYFTKIKAILCKQKKTRLYDLNSGLRINERYPFRHPGSNQWLRPELLQIKERSTSFESCLYNFVLEAKHVMIVNGMECLCLGHNFRDASISHPFYGSRVAINEALGKMYQDNNGVFTFVDVKRDQNNQVCGFIQEIRQVTTTVNLNVNDDVQPKLEMIDWIKFPVAEFAFQLQQSGKLEENKIMDTLRGNSSWSNIEIDEDVSFMKRKLIDNQTAFYIVVKEQEHHETMMKNCLHDERIEVEKTFKQCSDLRLKLQAKYESEKQFLESLITQRRLLLGLFSSA